MLIVVRPTCSSAVLLFLVAVSAWAQLPTSQPQACYDDPEFKDEQSYHCKDWLTFDCNKAVEDWNYSKQGAATLLAKCPMSCQVPACKDVEATPSQSMKQNTQTGMAMAESATAALDTIAGVSTSSPSAAAVSDSAPVVVTLAPSGDAERPECHVLAGTVGKAMQMVLFACSCAALIFKYRRDSGGRSWLEFLMDSSKQLGGAGWIHVLNLALAEHMESQHKAGDECTWYWLNIVLDCTIGVAIEYVLLSLLTTLVQSQMPDQAEDFESGQYKSKDGAFLPAKYFKQISLWLVVVSLMKVSMWIVMTIFSGVLTALATAILTPVSSNATVKLFVVMILTPVCFNMFQFWMVDNFIKKKGAGNDSSVMDVELDGSMRTRIQHESGI